jgi:hypothetical protein
VNSIILIKKITRQAEIKKKLNKLSGLLAGNQQQWEKFCQ